VQKNEKRKEGLIMANFIQSLVPHAQRIQKQYKILSSLVIAQACLESDYGKSGLATRGFNLFGVKGKYNGNSVTMRTHEYEDGKKIWIDAAFRKYPSWYESLEDLAKLYINGVSWDKNKYKPIIGIMNYKKACETLQTSGYCTDPNYAAKLIKIIEDYNLTQYDKNEKEEIRMYQPSNQAIIDSTKNVLARLEQKDPKGISKVWKEQLNKGELTLDDAIGLIFVAIDRGLIIGPK
jgi:flagellum-specific peptidoglycan hydrolase FlgJ